MKTLSKTLLPALVAIVTGTLMASVVGPVEANCAFPPFLGEICTFTFNFCPKGFVVADGRLLSINENQALFSLLVTTFGGDGRTTFGVPDLRGATVAGTGHGAGLSSIALGQRGGTANTVSVLAATPPDGVQVPATQLPFTGLTQCLAVEGVFPSID